MRLSDVARKIVPYPGCSDRKGMLDSGNEKECRFWTVFVMVSTKKKYYDTVL